MDLFRPITAVFAIRVVTYLQRATETLSVTSINVPLTFFSFSLHFKNLKNPPIIGVQCLLSNETFGLLLHKKFTFLLCFGYNVTNAMQCVILFKAGLRASWLQNASWFAGTYSLQRHCRASTTSVKMMNMNACTDKVPLLDTFLWLDVSQKRGGCANSLMLHFDKVAYIVTATWLGDMHCEQCTGECLPPLLQ